MAGYDECTQVTPDCPVEATVLGYYPNLGSGYFFTIAFGICLIASVVLGVWKRTWTYTAAITCGLILEFAGMFHETPFWICLLDSIYQIQCGNGD